MKIKLFLLSTDHYYSRCASRYETRLSVLLTLEMFSLPINQAKWRDNNFQDEHINSRTFGSLIEFWGVTLAFIQKNSNYVCLKNNVKIRRIFDRSNVLLISENFLFAKIVCMKIMLFLPNYHYITNITNKGMRFI